MILAQAPAPAGVDPLAWWAMGMLVVAVAALALMVQRAHDREAAEHAECRKELKRVNDDMLAAERVHSKQLYDVAQQFGNLLEPRT